MGCGSFSSRCFLSTLNGGECQAGARKSKTKAKPARKCKGCGERGHNIRTCPKRADTESTA